jgi:hypothetical protein
LEIIRLKLAKFRLNTPIGYGPRPFQLCFQKTAHLDELCRTRICRPTSPTGDQQEPAVSYQRTTGPERDPIGPNKRTDLSYQRTSRTILGPIGPPDYHTGPQKGPIGPVCDIVKQGIASTFRDSESSTTSKFIYVLRLGITPLMLKSLISSVQLVNSLF